MIASKTIHSFELSVQEGHTVLTAQEYPWSVLQVVPTTQEEFDETLAQIQESHGGTITHHDTDRTFLIIHLTSGDHDGKHPERFIDILTEDSQKKYLNALQDTMAQAAVWYYTNVIARLKN